MRSRRNPPDESAPARAPAHTRRGADPLHPGRTAAPACTAEPRTAAGVPPGRPTGAAAEAGDPPWWQTINRDRLPAPPAPLPPPSPLPQQIPRAPRPAPPAPAAAPPAPLAQGRSPSRRWWITTTAAVAVAVVVIGDVAAILSSSRTSTAPGVLDIAAAQRQIEQIIRDPVDGYGAATVTALVCNDGVNPAVAKGAEFTCEAVVDGVARRVAVVFQDDAGTYAVDRPR